MEVRIAIVGASSVSHGRRLLNDLFRYSWMKDATLALMAPHIHHLTGIASYAQRVAEKNSLNTQVEIHTNIDETIENADIAFLLYDAGGFTAFDKDYRITTSFGIDLCIGDTMGPTGTMKAIRNVAVLERVAEAMKNRAPDCLIISYVNPMAVMTMTAKELGIQSFVGICGGVEATKKTLSTCLEEPVEDLQAHFAGINHMTWLLELRRGDDDLYPLLRRKMTTSEWIAEEPARAEILQHFGYFVTETSGHISDFFPWFRRDADVRKRYCSGPGYTGASGAYHRFASYLHRRLRDVDPLQYEDGELEPQSDDYGPRLANAWLTGARYDFYGNVPNAGGAVPNLPRDAAVEVPLRATRGSINTRSAAPLPPHLAGLCNTNIAVQQVMVEAARTRDPQYVLAAISMDPLTASTIDLPVSRRLTEQLIEASRDWFPWLDGQFSFEDVDIRSGGTSTSKKSVGADVLEPVRRFDRQCRRREGRSPANQPNHD